jgi:lipopolysaccharide heptosyltransferase II
MRQPLNLIDQPKIDPKKINKILLIRLRRIGDVIMTTPAVSVLRKNFPETYISYVVEKPYSDLITGNPQINETLILPPHSNLKQFIQTIKKIRNKGYDTVIDFHGGPRAALITLFSGAALKIGYKIKYKHFIYHIKLPRDPESRPIHSVENHVNLVKTLGIKTGAIPPLYIPPSRERETKKVKQIISQKKLLDFKIISIHVGAGNQFRSWNITNYVKLCDLFSKDPEIKIVLLGAKDDKDSIDTILNRTKSRPISLAGELNLREVRDIISHSALFIGPDSGPMHIAASTRTPIVAFFGPTLPENFGPWRATHKIIQKNLDCRPCKQRVCVHKDFRCLQQITPEQVYEASLEYLSKSFSTDI